MDQAIDEILANRFLVWLKSRQVGASWLVAVYSAWTACFKPNSKVLLFSQGEDEARKLLAKVRFVIDNLPPGLLTHPNVSSNLDSVHFNKKGTWYIQALPSTIKAGRSETATLVVFDEADFHEYLELAYHAVKPTIDDSGGQMIILSTKNSKKLADPNSQLFTSLYTGSPGNGFVKLFFPWNVRPGRDQAWFEQRVKEYPNIYQRQKEYPASEQEALNPPAELMAFDPEILDLMKADTKEPLKKKEFTRIWQPFSPGKRYIAASDTAHGTGHDYSITVIMDTQTGMIVADVMTNVMKPVDFTYASINLLSDYDSPVWAPEDNGIGQAVIDTAQKMGYPRLYWRDGKKPGWHTTNANRESLWNDLSYAIQDRSLVIPAEDGLAQFYQVIRRPDKDFRIEAQAGGHDDYPLCTGIAWKLRRFARRSRSDEHLAKERKDRVLEQIMPRAKSVFKW